MTADEPVSTGFLADALGLTRQAIARLTRQNVLTRSGRGAYALGPNIRAYVDFRVQTEAGRRGTGSSDRMRDARAAEIEQRMALRDRTIITLDEANSAVDTIAGAFLSMLATLPARITRDVRERQRIEAIIDAERLRLSDFFKETEVKLKAGLDVEDDDEEET
jgi:hypothetical protein